jgi:hypothetical protein
MGSLVSILWTIAVILIVLWLLSLLFGLATSLGPVVHILLIVAIIVIVYNLLTSRRAA